MALVLLFLYIPIFVLIVFSFNVTKSRSVFSGFTFDWYIKLFHNGLIMTLYCFIFRSPMHLERGEIVILAVIAAIAGLISMVGDLTASAIKRNYDIKDYGKLIPGHGGILDRFDSMIITAPIIYFLALHML